MSLLNSIDRDHVLTAMETWDAAGGANYMLVRGGVSTHVLLHRGREYDAAAIAGIAHGLATGRTLTPADVPGGGAGASKALTRLGFQIRDDSPPERARPGHAGAHPALVDVVHQVVLDPAHADDASQAGRRGRPSGEPVPAVLHRPAGDGHLRHLRLRISPSRGR